MPVILAYTCDRTKYPYGASLIYVDPHSEEQCVGTSLSVWGIVHDGTNKNGVMFVMDKKSQIVKATYLVEN